MDDDAHEVGLGGGDGADGLGLGEGRGLFGREDWGQGGVVSEGVFGSKEILVRRWLLRDVVRFLLLLLLLFG